MPPLPKSRATVVVWFVVVSVGAAVPLRAARSDGARSVSARFAGEPLEEAVPRLGEAGGVPLKVERGLGKRRIFLFFDDRPLLTIRNQLQQFVPIPPGAASWKKEGPALVLHEDPVSKARRARRAAGRRRAKAAQRMRGYQAMLRWCEPDAADPPNLARTRSHFAPFVRLFGGLPEAARRAAFGGSSVAVPFQQLSPQARALVRQIVRGQHSGVEGRPEFSFDGSRDAADVLVRVTPAGTSEHPGLRLWLHCLPSPGGPGIPDIVNVPRWAPSEGWSWGHLRGASPQGPRGPKEPPADSAFGRSITLTGGSGQTVEKVLEQLARESKLPLLGEYDPCCSGYTRGEDRSQKSLPAGAVTRRPLQEAIEIVARAFDLTWDYHQGWIWIRSPRTPLADAGELDLSPLGNQVERRHP